MGGGNVEEVTCTVIGGVSYNPVCTSDSKLRTAEDEDSMTGALHSELALYFLPLNMRTGWLNPNVVPVKSRVHKPVQAHISSSPQEGFQRVWV